MTSNARPTSDAETDHPKHHGRIPAIEWICAALGAVLVSASVLFLFYKALFSERRPPEIFAEVSSVVVQEGGSLVMAEVRNLGGKTVAELTVTARADGVEKEATIDFIPAESSRRVGFFFDGIEAPSTVKLEIGSYRDP